MTPTNHKHHRSVISKMHREAATTITTLTKAANPRPVINCRNNNQLAILTTTVRTRQRQRILAPLMSSFHRCSSGSLPALICYNLVLVSIVSLVVISSHQVSCISSQQQQQPQHRTGTTDHSTDKQLLKKALDDQGNLSKSPSAQSSSTTLSLNNNSNNNNNQQQQQASSIVANTTTLSGGSVNFQCPEQFGYYTDTRDCTKYYVCVFGEVLHESCTGGLRFSRELQTCDWPRNVDCPQHQQQLGANDSSSTISTTTILPSAQLLQLKVQAASNSAKESSLSGNEEDNGDDEKPAAMKGSSLVFADEGSDPQQPSFDEAVSPVITPDGAIHLHDGSGGTYSLQASGAAAANAAGAAQGNVDVFVKALSPSPGVSNGRARSQAPSSSRRVQATNAKLLQQPTQRSNLPNANQQRQESVGTKQTGVDLSELSQDSPSDELSAGSNNGENISTGSGGDDNLAAPLDSSGGNGEPDAEQQQGSGQTVPVAAVDSIGAQADQTELAEERDRSNSGGAESEQDSAGTLQEESNDNGPSSTTVGAATSSSGYIPPVMANTAIPGMRPASAATNGPKRLLSNQMLSSSIAGGFNGLNSAGVVSARQQSGAFVPSFRPPSASTSIGAGLDSGESDDNHSSNLSEMNSQQAESRSNGRQNLLMPTGNRIENQTTTTTTTLHQHHPHPHQHQHLNLNINLQTQQQQSTRQSRMSSNFKPMQQQQQQQQQHFSHMQANLNQAGDMFDGQSPAAGRQAGASNRFPSQNTPSNTDVNDSAKSIRLQSSHQFELPSASSGGAGSNHFRPSQPFPAPSTVAGRSQNALIPQQHFAAFASNNNNAAAISPDQREARMIQSQGSQLANAAGDIASQPPTFNQQQQQQRRPRPPKRQQIPQGTNGSRNKPARGPPTQLNPTSTTITNNQSADDLSSPLMMIDQFQQQPPTTTISSQITTSAANAAVMQTPGQHQTATTASQFLSSSPAAAHHHSHHGHNHNQNNKQQLPSNSQRHQQRLPTTQSMFGGMMDSQTTRSSNANLPPFSQQITRPIVAPTTINFQQDFQSTASPTSTTNQVGGLSRTGNTATTMQAGSRQRFNQHVVADSLTNGNTRNLQNNNNQGQRAAQLLTSGESSTERPNLSITTTTTAATTDGSIALSNNDQEQDSELQIDQGAPTGNGVSGMRGSLAAAVASAPSGGNGNGNGLLVNIGSDSDSREALATDLNSNLNQNQAATATATAPISTTTTTNQEQQQQDPQLVANRYLNSAIDALEAGQPFGTVDYDFDILNDNSTDNRRNPASSSPRSTPTAGNRTPSSSSSSQVSQSQSQSQSQVQSQSQQSTNGNTAGLFYSNPTNANANANTNTHSNSNNNKQRQRQKQHSTFNRQQDGNGDDGESISLTNGQPTSGGVATNGAANQIGLNGGVRSREQSQIRASASANLNANGNGNAAGRQTVTGQNSFAASPNQQVLGSGRQREQQQQLPHLSAATPVSVPATPSAKLATSSGSADTNTGASNSPPTNLQQQALHSKKPRPTNKKITVNHEQALANNRASIEPAKRPEALFNTPTALQAATKCDNRVCRLPDCKCGDTLTPGGLDPKVIPQVILLTFDDAVNDLNWEIYEELFTGRTNPNGCPILATFYVSHEWTDYGQVQTLYSRGHEMASHSITHSFGEKFSKNQWFKEVNGQREILNMYGGVKMNDVRGMRAPFLQIGGNKMFEMLYDANFTYDSSMPIFENSPPLWPYTLDYQMTHECMITPCPTKSFPGVWEVGMTMWVDLRGGRCSMGDACSNPPDEDGVYEMLMKNFNRHYKSNRAPFGLFYHSAWFNTVHHRRGFLRFLATVNGLSDVFFVTNWQMLQWMRKPTPLSEINSFEPWQCPAKNDRPPPCYHPSVCNVKSEHGTRFMKTCQPCPTNQQYPWVGSTGFKGKQATANGSG